MTPFATATQNFLNISAQSFQDSRPTCQCGHHHGCKIEDMDSGEKHQKSHRPMLVPSSQSGDVQ